MEIRAIRPARADSDNRDCGPELPVILNAWDLFAALALRARPAMTAVT